MNDKRTKVLEKLKELNIPYELTEHPKVMTIEEIDNLNLDPNNEIVKNLFLCDDKRRNFVLLVTPKNKTTNLKALEEKLELKHIGFASESRLNQILNLNKGEVTPLSIINDEKEIVKVYFDIELKDYQKIGVHPNDNTATVWIAPSNVEKYVKENNHFFSYIKI